jgi:hypothetical protein
LVKPAIWSSAPCRAWASLTCLFISVKTVEGTLSRVYRKVGVRSRTALAHARAVAVIASGAATVSIGDDDQQQATTQAVTISQPGRLRTPRTLDTRR